MDKLLGAIVVHDGQEPLAAWTHTSLRHVEAHLHVPVFRAQKEGHVHDLHLTWIFWLDGSLHKHAATWADHQVTAAHSSFLIVVPFPVGHVDDVVLPTLTKRLQDGLA
jgi:hypothetical protein